MNLIKLSSLFLGIFLLSCSDDNLAGGVTDIGNSVAGIVVNIDDTPVANARVVAYYDSWQNLQIEDSVETFANENGEFNLKIDSTKSAVLYAESKSYKGIIHSITSKNYLKIGKPQRLESKIANQGFGTIRLVGSSKIINLKKEGAFVIDSLPMGDLTLTYSESNSPKAHFDFSIPKIIKDTLRIPPLENRLENGNWLTVQDYRYYENSDFGGIHIHVPENVIVPTKPKEDENKFDVFLHLEGNDKIFDNDSTPAKKIIYTPGISGSGVQLLPGQFISLDSLLLEGDFTITLWTKWFGPNGNHQILICNRSYWSDSTSRFQWHFENNSGWFTLLKSMKDYPDGVYFGDSTLVPINKWTHLGLVSKNGMVSMFVNGKIVEFYDGDSLVTAKKFAPNKLKVAVPLRVGGDEIATETWNGIIDEIHIQEGARSAEWIKSESEK